MKIKSTKFKDLKIIHSPIHSDKRGIFKELFKAKFFNKTKFVFTCVSSSKKNEDTQDFLSNVIKEINDRFTSDFNDDDKIHLEKIKDKIWKDLEWTSIRQSDATETNKRLVFKKIFERTLIDLVDDNLGIYEKFSSDDKKNFIQEKLFNQLNK